MTGLSIVLPTYNEAESVGATLAALQEALAGEDVEYLVVDDDSPDGTAGVAEDAGARVIVRKEERGLGTAVVRGLREARHDRVVVMDADGQHPATAVADLLRRSRTTDADLVVGSRHLEGGDAGGFGPVRRIISGGAALLGKVCLPPVRRHKLSDPMSGLFLVRRDRIDLERLRPTGYKILLEILARHDLQRVEEVGYRFGARHGGTSKLGPAVILQYLVHVVALGWQHPENRRIFNFGMVGASGVVVNLGLLALLTEGAGLHYLASAALSVEASILWNFLWNDAWTFRDRRGGHRLARMLRFNLVALAALGINLATLAFLTEVVGLHYLVSELLAILVTFTFNYLGNVHWTYGVQERRDAEAGLARRVLPWMPWLIIVASMGGFLFQDLDEPAGMYFDEHYYVSVAYQANAGTWEDPCWEGTDLDQRPLNFEHPPLAKLFILLGVKATDAEREPFPGCRDPDSDAYDDFEQELRDQGDARAWRTPSVLFGIATIALTGLVAARVTGNAWTAGPASLLVGLDGVLFTSSRMAMLDIFATAFTVGALYAATFPSRRGVITASVLLALGFISKFTVVFLGPVVLLVILWSHWRAGRLTKRTLDRSLLSLVAWPIPFLVLSYLPWWIRWIPEHGLGWALKHWYELQVAAVTWGTTVQSDHAYSSQPTEWPTLNQPVLYYSHVAAGTERYVYGIPNPVLWWATGLAAALLLVVAVRDWIQTDHDTGTWLRSLPASRGAALAGIAMPLLGYAGFLVLTRETFLFYVTILAPLLAIGLTAALHHLWRSRPTWGPLVAAGTVLLAVAAFAHYFPVLTAQPITDDRFDAIMELVPWMRR